jgi:hypothetical protein
MRITGITLVDHAKALCQDDNLIARDFVLLHRLTNSDLGLTIRVHIRRVPGIDAGIVSGFKLLRQSQPQRLDQRRRHGGILPH